MIGIVVVSHSAALAQAARDLALQMVHGARPVVALAGGLNETTFGTDAERIAAAITQADSPDGVLVLMDLGSALLSAEMACEFIDPEVADRVKLSAAPLVEGLVAAVVTAASGASLKQVMREAAAGTAAKAAHLGADPAAPTEDSANDPDEIMDPHEAHRLGITVPNRLGLHARPAAAFVEILSDSGITTQVTNLTSEVGPANGSSLVSIAGLSASEGDRLEIAAWGSESTVQELFARIRGFAEQNFGDDASETSKGSPGDPVTFAGPVTRLDLEPLDATPPVGGSPRHEQQRLDGALECARADLRTLVDVARSTVSDDAAEMVAAQLVFLDDVSLVAPISQSISDGTTAVQAWNEQLRRTRDLFSQMRNDYMRAREQDVWSLQMRVLRHLVGAATPDVADLEGVVLTRFLDAPTAVVLDVKRVKGVVTAEGGDLGHGAMILAERGIPFVADLAGQFDGAAVGTPITVPSH